MRERKSVPVPRASKVNLTDIFRKGKSHRTIVKETVTIVIDGKERQLTIRTVYEVK